MSSEPTSKLMPEEWVERQLGEALGAAFRVVLEGIGHNELFRNCSRCQHWQEGGSSDSPTGCGLYQMLPPVRVIVLGCDHFKSNDEIPF